MGDELLSGSHHAAHSCSTHSSCTHGFSQDGDWQRLLPWLTLFHVPGLGPIRYRALLDAFSNPEQILQTGEAELCRLLPKAVARAVLKAGHDVFVRSAVQADKEWLNASDQHHILIITDPRYPALLKTIAEPPVLLYIDGSVDILSHKQLAMVGCREPTAHGLRIAGELAEQLAQAGLVITSGLARGIDGAVHRGALSGGNCENGSTVAVLAGGVDIIYPQRHQTLAREISQNGALISEFALGTQPRAGHFPRRNRIISGLSLGVLVVEATIASGSLVTARCAIEQGRDVLAVPGSVKNSKARGCHALIREGAGLVESAAQVLEELNGVILPARYLLQEDEQSQDSADGEPKCPEQRQLLNIIGYEVCHHDELVARSGFSSQKVAELVLTLELDGLVSHGPGGVSRIG